jgi:hypothetical protein
MQYQSAMHELDPILKYSMDEMESKAFKIALIWQDECSEQLAGEKFERLALGRDPRKSNLFKYCYKMAKETMGIVPDKEARLYVRAQRQILKSIREGAVHALISPHCLVGEKAWKRWKVWRRMYERKMNKSLTSDELGIKTKESKVISDLEKTFSLLESKGMHDPETYSSSSAEIKRWILNGEISPFYAVLSPKFNKIVGREVVDSTLYRASITPDVEKFFREKFAHEFR